MIPAAPHFRRSGRQSARWRTFPLVAAAVGVAALAGCGDDAPSAERFCTEVGANQEELFDAQLATSGDIDELLDLYREVGSVAPLAVEDEWNQIVDAYALANDVVAGDGDAEQEALAAIFSAEESAVAVSEWLRDVCGLDVGAVFTVVAPVGTTVPPTTSTP